MEMSSMDATTNSSSAVSKDFYSFSTQDEKKRFSLRMSICTQIFGVCLFAIGLISGLLIGIYAFHGGPDGNKCIYKPDYSPTNYQREQQLIGTKSDDGNLEDEKTKYKPKDKPSTRKPPTSTASEQTSTDYCQACKWRNPLKTPDKPELWAPLTKEEMNRAYNELFKERIVNVKPGHDVMLTDSFIQSMFLHPPLKADALRYLNEDGPFPGRYATVTVIGGASIESPEYMHYKIGPLDNHTRENSAVSITPLLKIGEAPYNKRPFDTIEIREVILFVMDELYTINHLLVESFDARTPYQDLSVMPNGPFLEDGMRTSRFTIGIRGLGDRDMDFLNILPLNGKVYHGGRNISHWYVYDLYYINQGPFDKPEDLLKAYVAGEIQKVQYPKGTRNASEEMTFPARNMYEPIRENSHLPGTETFDPVGPRYTITGHDISWLGWSFSISCSQHRGPSIFNTRFKNESIIYENAVAEVALVYSADGSGQDNIVYFDSTYGIGESKKAIPGVDCPVQASYLRTSFWDPMAGKPLTRNTICVFEMDEQAPLWRHKGSDLEGGLRNKYLVVRFPTQIGNYDYIFDFRFFLDGRVENKVTATGFIQGSFWNPSSPFTGEYPERTPFGYRVAGSTMGLIHDHTFSFKVDIDVVDRENSFDLIHWKYGTVKDAMKTKLDMDIAPNYFFHDKTRYIEWERLQNETALDIDLKNQKFWVVVNDKSRNIWNNSRGYRIIPMASSAQNILDDYPRFKELSFTQHHCTITRHNENELFIKPIYNPADMDDPDPSKKFLQDMVNDESIENEDVVTWLSLGFLHIPTSEDVPMTAAVSTGFTLKPFNFFDRTAVFDIPTHALKINDTFVDGAPNTPPCIYQPTTVRG